MMGYRSLFQRSQAAPGISERTKQPLCSLCRVDPFNRYSVLSAGDRQTGARRIQCRADAEEVVQQ